MLSVVVPVYNEKDNVRTLLERTTKALRGIDGLCEVLIVDDDSPDGTAKEAEAVARELGASDMVRTIVRTEDRGLANAVMEGFRQAKGDVLAVMDADLSHPPELLPDLLKPIQEDEADIAVASRRCPGGGVSNWPIKRRIISWGAGLMARPLVPVKDTTSGFFAVRKTAIEGVELRPIGYKIGLEVFARAKQRRMVEVPFVFTDRVAGDSKLAGAVMISYLIQLAGLYKERFPKLVGFVQFGMVGLLGMVVDAAIFSLVYWYAGLARLGVTAGGFLAQTVSFLGAAVFNFILNRAWTFKERSSDARGGLFVLISGGGYVLRTPIWLLLARWGLHEIGALFVGIAAASVWNYFASRKWAFPATGHRREREAGDDVRDEMEIRYRNIAITFIFVLAVTKLFFAAYVDLTPDEAYYWQWSRHLDWGYHDHPPMVAYLIAAGTSRAGASVVGVRLLMVLLSSATLFVIFRLGRRWGGGARYGLWSVVGFAVMPLFSIGSQVAVPDIPFVFFWTASISHALKALRTNRIGDWLLLGIVLGLGMLSKYPMLLMPVALVAALLVTRERKRLLSGGPWIAAAMCALVCTPLVLWQIRRGFEGVFFQFGHGLGKVAGNAPVEKTGIFTFLEFIAGQLGVATPLLFILCMLVLFRGLVRIIRGGDDEKRGPGIMATPAALPVIIFPALLALGVFASASFFASSEANWPAIVYPSAIILLGLEFSKWASSPRFWRKSLAYVAIGFAALLSIYAQLEIAFPMFPYPRGVVTSAYGNHEVGQWASGVRDALGEDGKTAHIVSDHYQRASLLAFYMDGQPHTDSPFEVGSGSQYNLWRKSHPLKAGAPAIYFTTADSAKARAEFFDECKLIGVKTTKRLGVRLKTWRAYFGHLKDRDWSGVSPSR
jgi:dolichol-phosphate mannosyltransferase